MKKFIKPMVVSLMLPLSASAGMMSDGPAIDTDEPLAKRFSFCLKNYCAKNFWFLRPMLYLKHSGI